MNQGHAATREMVPADLRASEVAELVKIRAREQWILPGPNAAKEPSQPRWRAARAARTLVRPRSQVPGAHD